MNPTVVVKDPPRIVYADMLRLVAIFFVVLIHACTLYMYDYNLNLRIWSQTLIFDSFSRWCLPIFFMLSGMFLLNPKKEEPLSVFYKKRFATVLIPFITWTIIYAFRKSDVEGGLSVLSAFKIALSGPIYYHLWFVYTLVGLYLITPVIRIFVKHASDTELKYFLSLWFVFNSLTAILQNHFHISIGYDISYFTGYLGFFVSHIV
jgi:surface polysaccharide O-acyltransferase-like enzyme